MNRTGFWNDSLKIGAPSSMTTRFPCRSVLLMLIVMGLVAPAAPAGDFAGAVVAGATGRPAFTVGHGPAVGLGVAIHSRIDRAGDVVVPGAAAGVMSEVPARVFPVGADDGLAAGAGVGVGFGFIHSRIDWAGGLGASGSPATSGCDVVAPSASIVRPASILVLSMARPSSTLVEY